MHGCSPRRGLHLCAGDQSLGRRGWTNLAGGAAVSDTLHSRVLCAALPAACLAVTRAPRQSHTSQQIRSDWKIVLRLSGKSRHASAVRLLYPERSPWPGDGSHEGMAGPKPGGRLTEQSEIVGASRSFCRLVSRWIDDCSQSLTSEERRATAAAFDAVPATAQHQKQKVSLGNFAILGPWTEQQGLLSGFGLPKL